MPLQITVELVGPKGPKQLALARIANISDLADASDYAVYAREGANDLARANPWESRFAIEEHDRYQSVWALVAKVAARAAEEARERGR
jgi:hypothetical protein